MSTVEQSAVIVRARGGAQQNGRNPETESAVESCPGVPPRHIDYQTAQLDRLARSWLDVQQTRKALAQRELPDEVISSFVKAEAQLSRALTKTLRDHPLWPWLSQFPGLGGAHTALVIGRIGDPRRYPGQRCSEGHYLPPLFAVGAPCPVADRPVEIDHGSGDGADIDPADSHVESDGRAGGVSTNGADDDEHESEKAVVCPGSMLPPRTTTGVRSLWHWAGLHADDEGHAPRKRKGVQATWEPRVRASVMQPGGIAEQIVRLSVPVYADVYRAAKARLILRVAGRQHEIGLAHGDASIGATDQTTENDRPTGRANGKRAADTESVVEIPFGRPLRLHEADRTARKIAAKAFLGDLLTEWKGLV